MIKHSEYPILEFDSDRDAVINPSEFREAHGDFISNKLVITFFKDVINTLLDEGVIEVYKTLHGENDVIIYRFIDDDVLLMHGVVGCAATGGFLDELTGVGINKVMFCGGGGVLDKSIGVGELFVVDGAIRDEGFSYHYLPPSRIVYSEKEICRKICKYLDEESIPYTHGITWTTDAFYRETREKVALRKAEGARIVEMEQSGCIAVSAFRGIEYGAILYGGDDVSGEKWDSRSWHSRRGVRYSLVNICKQLLHLI